MSTKQVNKETAAQIKEVNAAEAVREAHEADVVQNLPFKDAKEHEAASLLLHAVFGVLAESSQTLEAKDLAVGVERQDDDPVRQARTAAVKYLYQLLTRTRPTLEAALGAEASARYGLSGSTPQQPDQLKNFAGRVVDLLVAAPDNLTDMFGNHIETAKIVAILKPAVQSLDTTIQDTKREASELDRAIVTRDEEAARLKRITRATFLMLESLFLLADQEEIFQKAINRNRTSPQAPLP